jgi:hypothetical protein
MTTSTIPDLPCDIGDPRQDRSLIPYTDADTEALIDQLVADSGDSVRAVRRFRTRLSVAAGAVDAELRLTPGGHLLGVVECGV